jgi:hydrogenase maturation protease
MKEYPVSNRNLDVAVLGIGNLLMSDDGVGIHAVQYMQKQYPEEGVCYIDGGTDAWGALWEASRCKDLIIVDAMFGGSEPGRLHRFNAEDMNAGMGGIISPHRTNALGLLQLSGLLDISFDNVVVVGMEAAVVDGGDTLSAECQESFPGLINLIREEIGKFADGSVR